ncbi:MAG: TetR/AcrR family transcriptional regulator [Minwuia sp.]|uniref:TetR/AcrR family transcriptional regulator n=1 Tax=Minwuia sp. TaxID=2493630 RepID=UPI003A8578AD
MPDTTSTARPRRARGDEEKAARRQAILEAARDLFAESGGEVPSVDQVARRAGLAKGTVYLYFGAKEEMFLALLTQELGDWIGSIAEALETGALDAEKIADWMTRDLLERTVMLRLAAQCHGTLERQVPEAAVVAFKQATSGGLSQLGELVEDRFPGLKPGEGPTLLLQTYALVIGLWQLADPPKAARAVVSRPEFAKFRPDFASSVRPGIAALLKAALDN